MTSFNSIVYKAHNSAAEAIWQKLFSAVCEVSKDAFIIGWKN